MIRSKKHMIIVDHPSHSAHNSRIEELEVRCEYLECRLEQSVMHVHQLSSFVAQSLSNHTRDQDNTTYLHASVGPTLKTTSVSSQGIEQYQFSQGDGGKVIMRDGIQCGSSIFLTDPGGHTDAGASAFLADPGS